MRPAIFHSKARDEIRKLPEEARKGMGDAIQDLQFGAHLGMPFSRPMPAVALGVEEIRVRCAEGIFRAFYFKKSAHGVLILSIFQKKTRGTPMREILIARMRLKELLDDQEEEDVRR